MTAIVTNAKSRIAYNVVKSLGRKGVPVYSADYVPLSMSFASRYSRGHFLYPSPFAPDQRLFVNAVLDQVQRLKARVLIPVSEETFLIAKYQEELAPHVKMVLPDYDRILFAHNKDRWEKVARDLAIHVPETYPIEELRRDPQSRRFLPFPLLIKPKQGGGGWGIVQVDTADDLIVLLDEEMHCGLPWDRFYLQRKISGATHCVAMLFNHGGLRAEVAYRQLREYPAKSGQATLRISIRNEKAQDNLQRLLEHLCWHGVCQADFVIDEGSGTPYLVDINPRFWGSLVQGIASGVDFPYLYYRLALDGDVSPVTGFRENVTTRWVGGDLRAFFPLLRAAGSKGAFLREFWSLKGMLVRLDDLSLSDPLPFFTWYLDALVRVLRHRSLAPVAHDSLTGIWE